MKYQVTKGYYRGQPQSIGRNHDEDRCVRSHGHQVTALSRREPAEAPAGATWQHGDAADSAAVAEIAQAHDAVVAAHGPSRVPGEDPSAFTAEFTTFADAVGDTRLIVVGGAGSLLAAPGVRLVDLAEFPEDYKAEALAHAAALDELRSRGGSTWSYLSPAPVIAAGERTGEFRISGDTPAGDWISYADYAVALVDEIERNQHPGARFTVASR